MHPAVSLQDVSHRYGDTQALHNVTLSLPTGCTVGLVGPDGVGKSTLLSIVAGVKRIQDGMVEVMGTDLADTAARQRLLPRIAYMRCTARFRSTTTWTSLRACSAYPRPSAMGASGACWRPRAWRRLRIGPLASCRVA